MWNEITNPFPKSTTAEVWEWISSLISHLIMDVISYPCLGLKLIHVSNKGPDVNSLCPVAYSAASHYLNQCWLFVNLTNRNNIQWNFNRKWDRFIKKNAFENVICKLVTVLSRPQYISLLWPHDTILCHRSESSLFLVMACCQQWQPFFRHYFVNL